MSKDDNYMVTKKEKPFEKLVIRGSGGSIRVAMFSLNDEPGYFVDLDDGLIEYNEFQVYGTSDTDEDLEKTFDDDFSSATQIGSIFGCHVPSSLIENLGADPYDICDSAASDLEAMYSVINEFRDSFEDIGFDDDVYYIHEIELFDEYQGFGYEKILLLQLPAIILEILHVFPTLLMYFPAPINEDEPEHDIEAEAILAHRMEYNIRKILNDDSNDNILMFPPIQEVSEKELNRQMGRRDAGNTVPEANRNKDLYELYESAGFEELGQTGWLCKPIVDIYSK